MRGVQVHDERDVDIVDVDADWSEAPPHPGRDDFGRLVVAMGVVTVLVLFTMAFAALLASPR